ncbi:MAG: hypothetical protein ACOZIN_11205, partial [Myxococcota bacterium]
LRHPTWKADLEMQGLFVEVLAARHPQVLEDLRTLAMRGQIELVSFHFSDQLFLAYPRRDMERSLALTRAAFAQQGLPLSTVVFAQEGQFSEGMLSFMRDHGLSTAVLAKHLLEHLEGRPASSMFFQAFGVDVALAGRGGPHADLEVEWDGPEDGEVIITGSTNPYLGLEAFRAVPEDLQKWEDDHLAQEAAGVRFITVSELSELAKSRAPFPPLPPITDGTWRPNSTRNVWRWMGAAGGIFDAFVPTEKDNAVLSGNVRASHTLRACEVVAEWAKSRPGAAERQQALEEAGRELSLAQVSDSTGWNPWLGEVNYSLRHAQAAIDAAIRCIDHPALRGAATRRVDLATGEVEDDPKRAELAGEPIDPLFDVQVSAPGRPTSVRWRRLAEDRVELLAEFDVGETAQRAISMRFPLQHDRIAFMSALDEERWVDYPASAFGAPEHTLPLPTGLVALGPNRYLIKDTREVHLAALVRPAEQVVEFLDNSGRLDEPQRWRFEVVDGELSRAMAVAAQVNLTPVVEVSLTPKEGCGCGQARSESLASVALGWVALLGMARLLRGRRIR